MKILFHPVRRPNEIREVEKLARQIWTAHYTPIIGAEQVNYMLARFQSETAILEQINQGMKYFIMDRQAGYFAYERKPDHLFLSKIYVHRDFRGQGWARRAVQWILEAEKPAEIRLTVNRHNQNSIHAYEKIGFQKTGSQVTDIGKGFVMDDDVMSLKASGK